MSSPPPLENRLIWMERTFRSASTAEQLLGPERENGVINPVDYDAAVKFLPGMHRHYNTVGTVVGAATAYTYKRPSWTPGRTASLVFFGAFTGRALGSVYAVFSFYRFTNSLRDPEGFAKAMDNVQRRMDNPGSIVQPDAPPAEASLQSERPATEPAEGAKSAWDRIRVANHKRAPQSSWDALRQSHERSRIPRQDSTPPENKFYDDTDRAQEQAKFDALLEKDRNSK